MYRPATPAPQPAGVRGLPLLLGLLALALVLGALSYWYYRHTLALGPAVHHAWAQADRLSLALNFIYNGFDLLHPATHNLLTREGVTGVEFPIHNYLVAVLMKLLGTEQPVVFRAYTLALSCIGLGFLFVLVWQVTGSFIKALFAALFVFTAPVYTYYQANFLPSVTSFACVLIGYYFYYGYRRRGRSGWFWPAMLFFTLAAASRMPFTIVLGAALAQQVLFPFRSERGYWRRTIIGFMLAFGFIAAYFLYNEYLKRAFAGSMFLTRPMPFGSLQEAREIAWMVLQKWGLQLFSLWHYLFMGLCLLWALAQGQLPRLRQLLRNDFALHFAVAAAGGITYSYLMGLQYIDHEYYFIDSYYVPVVFLMVWLLSLVRVRKPWQQQAFAAVLLLTVVLCARESKAVQEQRYAFNPQDRGHVTARNFEDAGKLLDSLNVPLDARILVLDAATFNLPLLQMRRRGYTNLATSERDLSVAMTWPADYVVTQDEFFVSDVLTNFPEFGEYAEVLGSNGKITVHRRLPGQPKPILQFSNSLDTPFDSSVWVNHNTIRSGRGRSGSKACYLGTDTEYGITFQRKASELGLKPGQRVVASVWCWSEGQPNGTLVVSLEGQGQAYIWHAISLTNINLTAGRWNKLGLPVKLPEVRSADDVLKVYVMKKGAGELWADDPDIRIYE